MHDILIFPWVCPTINIPIFQDLLDCTLSCGPQQIQAHKLILSSCSPFFRTVFKQNPHAHPLLYLKGISYTDLQAVITFMYHGEVNVAQEDLNNFLQVAEELKVKGLTQNGSEQEKRSSSNEVKHRAPSQPIKPPPPMKMAPRVAAPVVPSIQDTEDDIQEVEAEVKTEPGASGVMEQYQGAHEMAGAATYEEGYEYGDFGEQESYVMDTADQEKGEREQNTLGMMRFNCIMPWESVYFCCSGIISVM